MFLIHLFFKRALLVFLFGMSFHAAAQVKVDFDNLPYVEDYWTLPVDEIQKRAVLRDPFAQYIVGDMHYYGSNGYPYSEARAQQWQEKAQAGLEQLASQGNVEAHYFLGTYYLSSKRRDLNKALAHLQFAAEQGHVLAQYELGKFYSDKDGIYDPALSAQWYARALPGIEQGAKQEVDAISHFKLRLSGMYREGLGGLAVDEEQARYWEDMLFVEIKKHIATSDKHALHVIRAVIMVQGYAQRLERKPDIALALEAYLLAAFLELSVQNQTIKNWMESLRFQILISAAITEEELQQRNENCKKD